MFSRHRVGVSVPYTADGTEFTTSWLGLASREALTFTSFNLTQVIQSIVLSLGVIYAWLTVLARSLRLQTCDLRRMKASADFVRLCLQPRGVNRRRAAAAS